MSSLWHFSWNTQKLYRDKKWTKRQKSLPLIVLVRFLLCLGLDFATPVRVDWVLSLVFKEIDPPLPTLFVAFFGCPWRVSESFLVEFVLVFLFVVNKVLPWVVVVMVKRPLDVVLTSSCVRQEMLKSHPRNQLKFGTLTIPFLRFRIFSNLVLASPDFLVSLTTWSPASLFLDRFFLMIFKREFATGCLEPILASLFPALESWAGFPLALLHTWKKRFHLVSDFFRAQLYLTKVSPRDLITWLIRSGMGRLI